jgi:hypothetical protein
MRSSPDVESIADLEVVGEDNHYVWMDEDGEECGPTHKGFKAAVGFISAYDQKHATLTRKIDNLTEKIDAQDFGQQYNEEQREKAREALSKLSRSGKRPIELRRLLVRTYVAPLPDKHQAVVAALTAIEE